MDPSDRNYREIGHPRPRIARADLDRDIAAIKAKMAADAYEFAYHAGLGPTVDEAVAFASCGK
jgi:hypothetical protein